MSYQAAQLSAGFVVDIWVLGCTPQWGVSAPGALVQLAVKVVHPFVVTFRHFLFLVNKHPPLQPNT
jgi:hypothetical protein